MRHRKLACFVPFTYYMRPRYDKTISHRFYLYTVIASYKYLHFDTLMVSADTGGYQYYGMS